MWNFFIRFLPFIRWRKQVCYNFFAIPVVRDIGADMASQILPVKNYGSQSRASAANGMALATILFYWYYLTGHIRTYTNINVASKVRRVLPKVPKNFCQWFDYFYQKQHKLSR